MPTFQAVRLVGALRESFYDYKCSHMHQRHRYGMVHHRYCAEKHTYQPTRSAGCSSFALRNASGSKLLPDHRLSACCGKLLPDVYVTGSNQHLRPKFPGASKHTRLRSRCGTAMCEGWGGTEESEHRRQSRDQWETKTRAQAQKHMTQQRGTFPARRMLICSSTTAT